MGLAEMRLEGFEGLPLFAQGLLAVRMAVRGVKGLEGEGGGADAAMVEAARVIGTAAEAALTAAERVVAQGHGTRAGETQRALRAAMDVRYVDWPEETRHTTTALWYAIDALNAAEAAQDFPVDATVTRSALTALAALHADPALSGLQVAILAGSDLDLLRFACGEARVGRYDALGKDVLGRLGPVHGLTRSERKPLDDGR